VSTVPPYLGEFGDEDVRWLNEHGAHRRVRAGEQVITEGVTPEHIFVVLEGEFRVSSESMRDPDVMRVGEGQLLGEMSYINRKPPGASVFAVTDGVLLGIPRARVRAKIVDDPAFGSRFLKVLGEFAVDRMWLYNRRDADPPPPQPEPDLDADLRVADLIRSLLEGRMPPAPAPPPADGGRGSGVRKGRWGRGRRGDGGREKKDEAE